MNDDEYLVAQDRVIELCKDLLMIDVVGVLEILDSGRLLPMGGLMLGPKRDAFHRVAVSLRAAHDAAEEFRKVHVAQVRARQEERVRDTMSREFQERLAELEEDLSPGHPTASEIAARRAS